MPPHHSPSTSRHSVLGGLGLVLAVSVGAFRTPSVPHLIPQGQQQHGGGQSTCASCARSSIKPSQGPHAVRSALPQRLGAGSAAMSRLYSKQSSDVAGVGLDVDVAEDDVRPSTRSAARGGYGGGYSGGEGQREEGGQKPGVLLAGDGDGDEEDRLTKMLYSELSYDEPVETEVGERLSTVPSPQQQLGQQQPPHRHDDATTPASPPTTTKKRKKPLIARRDALFGGVGGSLGVWAIWRSAKDMQTRDQQKPESAFVWRPVSSEDEGTSSAPSGGYPAPFTTYLARLLLNFDPQCQSWWSATVADSVPSSMPRTSPQRQQILMNRFAEFSSSVALGLNDRYVGAKGAKALFDLLTQRFSGTENQRRAKEQIALLFSLLPPSTQPVERIRGLVDSLSSSAGTYKIFTVQQLNPSSTRILLQQTMRGMQQDPLMLMPARQMLPIAVGPDGTNAPSPSEAVYFRIPGLATVMPSLAAPTPQASSPTAADEITSSSSPAASAPSVEQPPVTARPSSAMAGFGPLSGTPVTKERPLGPETYSLFALAGAIGCSLTHMVVVPIDVVKTRAQTQKAAAAAAAVSPEATVDSTSLVTEVVDTPTATKMDTTDDVDGASPPLAAATATAAAGRTNAVQGLSPSLSPPTSSSSSSTTTSSTPSQSSSSGGSGGGGIISGIKEIYANEGLKGLFCGVEPTLAGYTYYGITVYPGYEFFKRALTSAVSPAAAVEFHAPLVILAGALATVIACVGVCPAEAIRIRMVARREEFGDTVMKIVRDEGISSLYDGFPPLLVRQVLFGMMKFLVFDSFAGLVLSAFPELGDQVSTRLAVSLLSGAVAGVASAIVSQPADTILSRMNTDQRPSLLDAVRSIVTEHGPGGFFLGLSSRCLWSGSIISGQFLLYDVFKTLLHVTQSDLQTYMDVIGSLQASL